MKQPKRVVSGGYWAEGVYITYVVNLFDWGVGHELYVRDSWINGRWVSCTKAHDLNEMLPEADCGEDTCVCK